MTPNKKPFLFFAALLLSLTLCAQEQDTISLGIRQLESPLETISQHGSALDLTAWLFAGRTEPRLLDLERKSIP